MPENSFKVVIGGVEYKLTSQDEVMLKKAAEEVDTQLNQIRRQYSATVPVNTLSVLAALNIAQNKLTTQNKYNEAKNYLKTELNKMCETLEQALK
jgi:cell division protein ZapA (FtsZ GTPase activity inhibitor)